MSTDTEAPPDGATAKPKRRFKFPTAFTVLFFVLVLVWILTFIIKPGTYSYVSCDGGSPKPIPGTFNDVKLDLSFQERLYDLWVSPVNGLYGMRTPSEVIPNPSPDLLKKGQAACGTSGGKQVPAEIVTPPGNTGPYNSGDLAGAVQVFFFVLAIGAFITVTIKTGALDAGIGRVTDRFRKRGLLLIVILMVIFSVGGTTYGMAEETLGFYAIILPVIIALGYDRLVGVGIIMVGAGVGTLASTVNPFATGVASDAAGVALGDGIGLRLIMYVVMTAIALLYVLRYARRVKNDPAKSHAARRRRRRGPGQRPGRAAGADDRPAEDRAVDLRADVRADDLLGDPVGGLQLLPGEHHPGLVLPRTGRVVPGRRGAGRAGGRARRGGHGHRHHLRRR